MSAVDASIPVEIPASHRDLLDSPLTAVLTTVGADGQPQSTAVWFLFDGDVLKTSVMTSRQKYQNLSRNPLATLFVMDPANPYRYVEVRAEVEIVPDPDKALLPVFSEKYGMDVSSIDPPGATRAILIFHRKRVVTFG